VSENDDCHSAATTKIVVESHGKGLLRVLQSSSENRYRGCRHDCSITGSSIREGSITDARQLCI